MDGQLDPRGRVATPSDPDCSHHGGFPRQLWLVAWVSGLLNVLPIAAMVAVIAFTQLLFRRSLYFYLYSSWRLRFSIRRCNNHFLRR